MNILGIETSCDETAVAIVKDGKDILSNIVASSETLHAKTGGIIPENAARRQIESMLPVLTEALNEAFPKTKSLRDKFFKIDAIAVTVGPGLIGSLLVGVETAKVLSKIYNKPLTPVNHLVAHLYANFVNTSSPIDTNIQKLSNEISKGKYVKSQAPKFPALGLVVSGGHTDFVLMKGHGDIKWLGGTRDDAAGEAFDKTARLIGLPYPGGPEISKHAQRFFDDQRLTAKQLDYFPRPMIDSNNLDMSFSGLKTAVLNETKSTKHSKKWFAAQIQEAIVDTLVSKSLLAIKMFKPKSFLLSGGVAANGRLNKKFVTAINSLPDNSTRLYIPPPYLCTDNGVVIAASAYYNQHHTDWQNIFVNPSLAIDSSVL